MKIYYFIAVVFSCVNLIIFMFRDEGKKTSYYLKLLEIILAAANCGYLVLGLSTTLSEAFLANKISYIGGCFMPPIMAFCMCSLCNIKIRNWVKRVCLLFSMAVYIMVFTSGYTDFYYRTAELGNVYDATAIVNTHGPGYNFFYVILFGYLTADLVITYIAVKQNKITKKNLCLLIIMQAMNICTFTVGRIINPLMEYMPALYAADGFIFNLIQADISKYNLEDKIYETSNLKRHGYIVFDKKYHITAVNDAALSFISELSEFGIDDIIPADHSIGYLTEWITGLSESGSGQSMKNISRDDRYYECTVKTLWSRNKKHHNGYIIEIQDQTERRKYLDLVSKYNEQLENQVEEQTERIEHILHKTVIGMANMVENRDNSTGGHIRRTSDVMKILTASILENELMDVSEDFCDSLVKAAPMHDLGKIAIDDYILRKPGRFTDDEYSIMKTHSARSAEIVEQILRGVEDDSFVDIAVNVARYHHEKWDGSGYPEGLSGSDIPLEARIMAVADVYDALVSKRCYKEAMNFEQADEIMLSSMGSHFDPSLKQVYELSRSRLTEYYSNTD